MPVGQDTLVFHFHANVFPLLACGMESGFNTAETLHLVGTIENRQLGRLPFAEFITIGRESHPHALGPHYPVVRLVTETDLYRVDLGRDGQLMVASMSTPSKPSQSFANRQ